MSGYDWPEGTSERMTRSAEFGAGVSSARPDRADVAPQQWTGPSEAEWQREERWSKNT